MIIKSKDDENSIRTSNLNIYTTKIESIVKMSSLEITGSSLYYKRKIEKGSTVNNNTVGTTGLRMSGWEVTNSSLRYEEVTKKGSIVNNDGVRTTGFKIRGLRETNSNLHQDGCPQCRQSTSKGLFIFLI